MVAMVVDASANQRAWLHLVGPAVGDEVAGVERSLFGQELSGGSHSASIVGVSTS
jgi:hypothetical protein